MNHHNGSTPTTTPTTPTDLDACLDLVVVGNYSPSDIPDGWYVEVILGNGASTATDKVTARYVGDPWDLVYQCSGPQPHLRRCLNDHGPNLRSRHQRSRSSHHLSPYPHLLNAAGGEGGRMQEEAIGRDA
jgi:hypothetical protein